jgi:hypothetical protein
VIRFGFSIRTKTGQRVQNIQIVAATLGDAERRLRQMYQQCEIIDRRERAVERRGLGHEIDQALGLLGVAPLGQETSTH